MARYRNTVWNLADDINAPESGMGRRQVAVLMDIRYELQQLNTLLGSPNFVSLPSVLRQVRDHTRPRPPHRRLPRNVRALEIAAKQADDALDVATRERERVVSALTEAYRRAK